jgi:hypothetical protein
MTVTMLVITISPSKDWCIVPRSMASVKVLYHRICLE